MRLDQLGRSSRRTVASRALMVLMGLMSYLRVVVRLSCARDATRPRSGMEVRCRSERTRPGPISRYDAGAIGGWHRVGAC